MRSRLMTQLPACAMYSVCEAILTVRYGLDNTAFEFRERQNTFVFSKMSRRALEPTQPYVQCAPGGEGVKEAGT